VKDAPAVSDAPAGSDGRVVRGGPAVTRGLVVRDVAAGKDAPVGIKMGTAGGPVAVTDVVGRLIVVADVSEGKHWMFSLFI